MNEENNLLKIYYRDIAFSNSKLTKEKIELLLESGSQEDFDEAFQSFLLWVFHEAIEFFRSKFFKLKTIDLADIIQEANIEFLRALRRWDPDKGASIETYTKNRIRGSTIDWVRKNGHFLINPSRSIRRTIVEIAKLESISDIEELSKKKGFSKKKIKTAFDFYDLFKRNEDNNSKEEAIIEALDAEEFLEGVFKEIEVFSKNDEKVKSILCSRLGFRGTMEKLSDIAKDSSLSEGRISQIVTEFFNFFHERTGMRENFDSIGIRQDILLEYREKFG